MALPDISNLTDEELPELLTCIHNLQRKRERLAETPVDVAKQVASFVLDGGDVADVQAKIAEALEPPIGLDPEPVENPEDV